MPYITKKKEKKMTYNVHLGYRIKILILCLQCFSTYQKGHQEVILDI